MPYFGILEDKKLPHVPGTVLLDQLTAHSEDVTGRLKHGTGKNANIVLVPQPSEDPNDPLNWPAWKKALAMSIVQFGAILVRTFIFMAEMLLTKDVNSILALRFPCSMLG